MFYEMILPTDDCKIRLAKLVLNPLSRNFVLGGFRNSTAGQLWFAIDNNQPSRWNQRLAHMNEDRMRICEFMVSVQNEHCIHVRR